jgi:hypothetical protein
MSDSLVTSAVTVIMAIVGVAIIAVLVSKNANTSGVLGAGASGLSTGLGTALSPITGGGSLGLSFSTAGAS